MSENADIRVRLDPGQMREISDAKRQSMGLERELKAFRPQMQREARSIAEATARSERFVAGVFDRATKLLDVGRRAADFFSQDAAAGNAIEAGRLRQLRTAGNMLTGAFRAGQAVAPLANLFDAIPGASSAITATAMVAGAKLGALVEERREEGDRRVYAIERDEAEARREFYNMRNKDGFAVRLANDQWRRSAAAARRAFKRVTR